MTGNSVLLDSSVIVHHFRNAAVVSDKLAAYEELYVPQTALGELYYGAFQSARTEENLRKIERFLVASDVLAPTTKPPGNTGRSPRSWRETGRPSRKMTFGSQRWRSSAGCRLQPRTSTSGALRA